VTNNEVVIRSKKKEQNKNRVVSLFVFYFKREVPRRVRDQCPLAEIPVAPAVTGTPPREK